MYTAGYASRPVVKLTVWCVHLGLKVQRAVLWVTEDIACLCSESFLDHKGPVCGNLNGLFDPVSSEEAEIVVVDAESCVGPAFHVTDITQHLLGGTAFSSG